MTDSDLIWLEKYRPSSLKDYLDYSKFINTVQDYILPIKNTGEEIISLLKSSICLPHKSKQYFT